MTNMICDLDWYPWLHSSLNRFTMCLQDQRSDWGDYKINALIKGLQAWYPNWGDYYLKTFCKRPALFLNLILKLSLCKYIGYLSTKLKRGWQFHFEPLLTNIVVVISPWMWRNWHGANVTPKWGDFHLKAFYLQPALFLNLNFKLKLLDSRAQLMYCY